MDTVSGKFLCIGSVPCVLVMHILVVALDRTATSSNESQTDIFLSGMVLCLKSAEALSHLMVGGSRDQIEWFPSSFLPSKGRMSTGKFEGRRDMKP
jgi:hypothetical protein